MNNQAFSKIWIIVILVALIGGGILVWNYSGIQNNDNEINEEVSEDETMNQRTYTNEEYGYSFKYPSEATINEAPLGDFIAVENYKKIYEKYTGKICININYNQANLYISAPDNKDDKYVFCPYKGLGIGEEFSGKPISELVTIAGKTYTAEGSKIIFEKTGFRDEILDLTIDNGTTFYYSIIDTKNETELLNQKM